MPEFVAAGGIQAPSATISLAMAKLSRRKFLKTASVATLAPAAARSFAAPHTQRVFIGSNTPDGILAYDWDPATAELTPAGIAAKLANVDWITFSPRHEYLYAAYEVDSFNGKPTGAVASFRVQDGQLHPLSAQNSASAGTCHVALDQTGRVLLSADYGGGSAASFLVTDGQLSPLVWSEHYTAHGPNPDRQKSAHAHFASFSPDNRFAYINDLGGDCIHIYGLDTATARLTPAGTYQARPGAGCRTLHFHPNGHTAYCVNELDSTVDVLEWHTADGSLTLVARIELLPATHTGVNTACDTVISKDGRSVYFANRGTDFLFTCKADPHSGALTPMGRSNCGGKTPRNFTLDPTERWMLVANQNSNLISVFARDPETGALAEQGKSFAAAAPMCIVFE
ncbi:MAG: lactonase family protein [Terracidiphilus sp.]|jgi:6-phosphogluconolactonase